MPLKAKNAIESVVSRSSGTTEKHGADTTTFRTRPYCLNQSSIEPLKFGREGEMIPGFEPVPSQLVGKAFERSVDDFINGDVLFVDALKRPQ